MKNLIILLFCIAIANGIQAASFGREYDGYNYDKPSISLEQTAPSHELVKEEALEDTEQILKEEETPEAPAVAIESEVPNNEANEINENIAEPAEAAENSADTNLAIEVVAQDDVSENNEEPEVPADSNQEYQPIPEVNEAQLPENPVNYESEQQNQETVEENIELEAPIVSNDEVEEAPQSVQETVSQEVDPALDAGIEIRSDLDDASTVSENSGNEENIESEAPIVSNDEVEEAPQSVQETVSQEVEPALDAGSEVQSVPDDASNVVENSGHEISGYTYEKPKETFTQPPPLAEQVVVEENFMHQELASAQKPHRQGAVKRVKLHDPAITVNAVSSCNGRDWREDVAERHEKRPKSRRTDSYAEQTIGEEYFQE